MKKLVLVLVCVFTMQMVMADNEKPIQIAQLPQTAQTFIKQNFPGLKVAFAKVEKDWFDTSYDVMFTNGDKLEFNKNGEWKEIRCNTSMVPVKVIPAPIQKFVKENYPDAKVASIEKDRYEYEVRLSNRMEVKFDLQFNVIDMDTDD